MTPEEHEVIKSTVMVGVQKGLEPIYEKLEKHSEKMAKQDTAIALNQQELYSLKNGQKTQGERIGELETESTVLKSKIKAHLWWILGILSFAGMIVWFFVKMVFSEV